MLSLLSNPPVLLLTIGHRDAVTKRAARRSLIKRARAAVRLYPQGRLDIACVCEDGLGCCRLEALEVTAQRVAEVVEDACGLRPYAFADSRRDRWMRL